MVYLATAIKSVRTELILSDTIQKFCYFYVVDRFELEKLPINLIGNEEVLAAQGFKSLPPNSKELSTVLQSKPIRGIHYTTNVFKLLGIHLASGNSLSSEVAEKYEQSSIKYKYLISKVLPEYESVFQDFLGEDKVEKSYYREILKYIYSQASVDKLSASISKLLEADLDVIDLIILEELQQKFISNSITETTYLNLDVSTLVKQVLLQFGNSVKKITLARRKGHDSFQINDEYDVQDILYVMLKPLFPTLTDEEPTPKVGAKYNKIDLILREHGLMIEVKMIKASDTDEKKFIEQLKNDIQSYYRYSYLRELLVIVYDPQNKTRDLQNFYELNGTQEIQGVRFEVQVIVGN